MLASLDLKNAFCTIQAGPLSDSPPEAVPTPATVARRGGEPAEQGYGGELPRH